MGESLFHVIRPQTDITLWLSAISLRPIPAPPLRNKGVSKPAYSSVGTGHYLRGGGGYKTGGGGGQVKFLTSFFKNSLHTGLR